MQLTGPWNTMAASLFKAPRQSFPHLLGRKQTTECDLLIVASEQMTASGMIRNCLQTLVISASLAQFNAQETPAQMTTHKGLAGLSQSLKMLASDAHRADQAPQDPQRPVPSLQVTTTMLGMVLTGEV